MYRILTFLILQSGVTFIPHHLGLEILLYHLQGPDFLYLNARHRSLFCRCPMRDHGGGCSLVEVRLERAALDSTKGVASMSAPQADEDQDEDKYRDAVFED